MKVFFLVSRFPWPLEKGDKLRAYHQIEQLSKKHEVILCAVSDAPVPEEAMQRLKAICSEVHVFRLPKPQILLNLTRSFFNGWPFQVGYFYRKKIHDAIRELLHRHRPDAVFCQLIRMAEYVRREKGIRRVLDYMDVFSKGMERRSGEDSLLKRPAIRMEYRRLLRYEREVFADFDAHLIISAQDRDHIPHPDRSRILVIPNGVDTDYFSPSKAEKKYDVLFSGNMGYPPNVESALFTAREIMPALWKHRPGARLIISGASPTREVQELAEDRITVTGWVDDIRTSFAESRVMVAPMHLSIGLQNKILQAFSMKIPCVVSRLSNNAVGAPEESCVRIAETGAEYATHILHLLEKEEEASAMTEAAYRFVHENYNWASANQKLEKVLFGK